MLLEFVCQIRTGVSYIHIFCLTFNLKLSSTDTCTVVDVGWQPISIDSLLEPDDHNCCAEFQLV